MRCVALRCAARRCDAVRCAALRCAALRCAELRGDAMRCNSVRCAALSCAAVRCGAMQCAALRCDALRCAAYVARWLAQVRGAAAAAQLRRAAGARLRPDDAQLLPRHLRAVHGAVYLKEMNVETFLKLSRSLEDSIENSSIFKD